MCRPNDAWSVRAFWSVDAAFALVLSVAMLAMFSAMLYSAGRMVLKGADETSGALLSARFSAYALSQVEKGKEVDLQAVLEQTGRKYASLRAGDGFAYAGDENGSVYCTVRLYVKEGTLMKLEACVG